MPDEIRAIETGGSDLPEDALTVTGNCSYRFANGGWDWFIRDYGNRVTTNRVYLLDKMFMGSKVEEIPFEINCELVTTTYHDMGSLFQNCNNLKVLPIIKNAVPRDMNDYFSSNYCLREIPNNFCSTWDWSVLDELTNQSYGKKNHIFYNCFSLRYYPNELLRGSNWIRYSSSLYYYGFTYCYSLDEIINLPCITKATWTSNSFAQTVSYCSRLKNLTFSMQDDGTPCSVKWKSQALDLSQGVGYAAPGMRDGLLNHNSGITADKEVTDQETYQALKDDPDWFTQDVNYSRYNHDSAVATINSLPDASAYLATAGGTNTIKFQGACGALTDGGAISNLTEEEIAVAAAKGWTVSIV